MDGLPSSPGLPPFRAVAEPQPYQVGDILRLLARNWIFLIVGPLLGLALGFLAQQFMPAVYEARGTFVVNELPFGQALKSSDAETERSLVQTLILSIPSTEMLRTVEMKVGAEPKHVAFIDVDRPVSLRTTAPAANIRIDVARNSRLGTIEAQSQFPEFAAQVVNVIMNELLRYNQIGGKLKAIQFDSEFAKRKVDTTLNQSVELSSDRIKLEREVSALDDHLRQKLPIENFPSFNTDATLNNLKTQLILVQSQYDSIAASSVRGAQLEGKRSELDGLRRQVTAHAGALGRALRSQYEITSTQEHNVQADMQATQKRIQFLDDLNAQLVQAFGDISSMPDISAGPLADIPNASSSVIVIVEKAAPKTRPVSPKLWLNLLLGGLFGVGLGFAIAALRTLFDRELNSRDRIERLTGLPCLAVVPRRMRSSRRRDAGRPVVVGGEITGLGFLRSRLLRDVRAATSARIIAFTPANAKSEASAIVAEMARQCAHADKKTLVVDLHIAAPRQAEMLGLKPEHGLAEWLNGHAPLREFVTRDEGGLIGVIAPGRGADIDRLSRRPISDALPEQLAEWDLILVDAPSVMADWSLLTSLPPKSQTIIAVDSSRTTSEEVIRTTQTLRDAQWEVLGVVLIMA